MSMKKVYITEEQEECRKVIDAFEKLYEIDKAFIIV